MNMEKIKLLILLILVIITSEGTVLSAVDVENDIIKRSQNYLGTPYVYGGVSPAGFDCSGFVYFIYKELVSAWPRVTRDQGSQGVAVNKNALIPGDLTFWATGSDPARITHVSIYLGNDSMIHALSEGPRRGIAISSMKSGYWTPKYLFSRRIFASSGGSGSISSGGNSSRQQGGNIEQEVSERQFARGRYSGQLSGGRPHGKGTYFLNNGDIYEGDFRNGIYHGRGKYTIPDGTVWEGTFVSGKLHGEGTRIWPTGARYEGMYENGYESGGWHTSSTGKMNWVLRTQAGRWIVYEDKTESSRLTDTAPAFSGNEEEHLNYIFEENPWDAWEGIINFPDDWETGPLFEEVYIREQKAFQDSRASEQEAFERYKSEN